MKKKLCVYLGFMILLLTVCSGCSEKKTVSDDFKTVVDEYAKITLKMDAESGMVDAAYESIGKYLENQNPDQLDQTMEDVKSALSTIEEKYQECKTEPYEVPEEISDMMEECGIHYEDFTAYVSEEEMFLENYKISLEGLEEYLGYEKTDLPMTDELTFYYEMVKKTQEIQRYYMYTGINYWFFDCSEEELAYIDEAVTEKLVSYCSDGHEWDKDQADVEERMSGYLDELADLRLDWETHLGEQKKEINKMRQELEKND